ncbi:RNA-directed DNA polymerase from mobile element jockey [Trichonephila clavipes]|nr:RNA-directed DNA polymerase from mobile element jockey [Trichonephila clavipes]
MLLVIAFSIRKGDTVEKYASTHHGAQQGEAARRSSDMRQARHLPQRWYWSIVLQPIDRSGLTPASRLRRSMGQRARNRNPRLHFPPVRVAAHGKHAGQTQKPVLTLRKTKSRSNTNGNILCNWAVGSALDIIAPDTPTHFNAWHTNNILDIGFAANLAHTDVFTINALSSDYNPVIFDFITNNILPPILRTLKSTNWIKFQEILYHNIPGNPQIDNLDTAVQNFTDVITNAIAASTSTRVINTPHLSLPENIRELIRAKKID